MIRLAPLPVLAAVLALAACSGETAAPPPQPRLVQLGEVQSNAPETRHEFVGRVEARLSVDMAFQVGGQLADLPLTEGQRIAEGDLVARLDLEDFELARQEARVQLQQARTDLERQRTLHERGIASQAALDSAQTQYDLRLVALENAQRNLQYATLTAPFDGLVSRRLVDNFTIVSPGQPIVRIQDVGELRVSIPVSEDMVATFDQNNLVALEAAFSFLPGQTFSLIPRELVSEPDDTSNTYRAIAALPDDIPANILPGMTATVWAEVERNGPVTTDVMVPLAAVSERPDGSNSVWVYDADTGTVSPRMVETAGLRGSSVVVTDGVQAGDLIVTAGVSALHEGMEVRPLDDTQPRFGTAQ
ncbi:efflux RND transporter periplasmic adaptor subunit [Maricaulis sp.]|uniref:efflux RND transporter periplasmic adaptor subunit n=1 Tax=Maricaulis sp. TaxID=1486257 RepID=UPI001B03429A|nr:efflux RND transporter periplasmic adaptor subunit [Maricaulis sp.]MBO6764845.1 efflux RND transporter periplasmic adaptor subunit [Maricaulis sp.]